MVSEFTPYVFQLFAALLESNPSASLPEYYKQLIPPMLTLTLWESKGNVPALVRFLSAVIPRSVSDIASEKQIEPILVIFQKLLSTKADNHAFDLLEVVVGSFSV